MFRRPETETKNEPSTIRTYDSMNTTTEKPTFRPSNIPTSMVQKEETPETTLGEEVSFKGELSFQRYLRIDGHFEGKLVSQGKLHVGPKGVVKSNVQLQEAIIEGKVEGNLTIQGRLELRGNAKVHGDIQAKSIKVEEGVSIIGIVNVNAEPHKE